LVFGEFEFLAHSRLLTLEGDADHGHVAEEVDGADIDLGDLDTEALLEVGDEFRATLGGDELDAVVLYETRGARLDVELAEPHGCGDDQIGEDHLEERHIHGDGIHQREGDDDEEIGHLTDRHRIGAVTHDGEDAEESDTHTHRGLALHILEHEYHEEDDEEDGYGDEHEREVEVAAAALTVVQAIDDEPCEQAVDQQADEHHHKVIRQIEKIFHIVIIRLIVSVHNADGA